MKRERVTEAEIRSSVRSQGISEMKSALAVVLETDGSMTVLKNKDQSDLTAMKGVVRKSAA